MFSTPPKDRVSVQQDHWKKIVTTLKYEKNRDSFIT